MGTDLVPWWGWLILVVLCAVWILLIGFLMEAVRWIAEKILGTPIRQHHMPAARGSGGTAKVRTIEEARHTPP